MSHADLSVATISLVRNNEEEKTLCASLSQLAKLSLPVFITDGGSPDRFIQFLHSLPGFTVCTAKGLWAQAKTSISEAAKSGSKTIFYTEPDKQMFFQQHLPWILKKVGIEDVGVLLASRSAKGFATFPPFQQLTETCINQCCKEVIGKEVDYCYGPFFFHSRLVSYLHPLTQDCGWGWRTFLFATACRLGFSIDAAIGDFVCPPAQSEDNAVERLYRMKQLTQNIEGLLLAASLPL